MSWEIGSLIVLTLALAGGFGWYERSQPSAKVLALVATLAALAALGRIAFAPLPNVKPTTDIVLIAGLALGGAPGFCVGALGALSSNLFFGQGPWTPWQMFAWGSVGLFGALIGRRARAGGKMPGRVTLALCCGAAGLGFGVIMNLFTWLTFTGDQSLGKLFAIMSAALPFDFAHAIGNVLFFLAFGPALIASITRFRTRLQVTWRPAPSSVAAVAAALALAAGLLAAAADTARAATPLQYMATAQNADGGWGGAPGQGSTQLFTGWAALGVAAAGVNPQDFRAKGRSPVDYIRAGLGGLRDTGEIERTILVLHAAGRDARSFGGRNLLATLLSRRRSNGSIGGLVNHTAFGVLAMRASGMSAQSGPVKQAVTWLAAQQNPDGGYNFGGRGGQSGIDDSAAVIQALAAGGRRGQRSVSRAVSFIASRQVATGGFPLTPGGSGNAQSAAWAVQALVAGGRNPDSVRRGGRSALGYIRSLTEPGGAVRYSRTSLQTPVWVTAQALTALHRRAFPLRPIRRGRTPAAVAAGLPDPVAARKAAAGGEGADRAGAPGPGAPGSGVPIVVGFRIGAAVGLAMVPLT